MKRFLPTIILVVVCIAGFWYASSQNFFKKEEEATTKPLVTVKKEDITAFSLKTGTDTVELQLKDNVWSMSKPSALPLSTMDVDGWTSSFVSLTQDGEVDANPSDLAGFGLANPASEYTVTLKNGSTQTVQVGNPLPIAGYSYVKLKDAPNVYKLSDTTLQGLQKQAIDFMKKMPIEFTYSDVQSLVMTWNGASKTLTKSDTTKTASESTWKFGEKELQGTDATAVLDKALLLSTDQLAKPASQVTAGAPELKVDVKQSKEGKETTESYTGKVDGDNVWIVKQGDTWAYAVAKTTVQEMFDALQ